jgi:hypothetical protein
VEPAPCLLGLLADPPAAGDIECRRTRDSHQPKQDWERGLRNHRDTVGDVGFEAKVQIRCAESEREGFRLLEGSAVM